MTHKSGGRLQAARLSILLLVCAASLAAQTVYPTGTTIYDPARAWSGYTVLSPLNTPAVIVIDMNGNVVKQWDGFVNSAGGPARVFPGGFVMAANGSNPPRQESLELVQRDFDGKILSRFGRNLQIQTRDGKTIWSARQHHDWQREDYPAGYYSPEANPSIQGGGNTLVLTHVNHDKPAIADAPLEDDRLSSRSRRRARSRGNGSRATTSRNSASPRPPGRRSRPRRWPGIKGTARHPPDRGTASPAYHPEVPYGWIPQLTRPAEHAVVPPPIGSFRVP